MTALVVVGLIWLAILAATLLVEWRWPEWNTPERAPKDIERRLVGAHYSGPRIPSAVSAPDFVGPSAGQAESGDLAPGELMELYGK